MRLRLSMAALMTFCAALSAQDVRITWIGQAGFMIQTAGGPTVIADPPAANIGYPLPATPADVVTVSHNHGDHNFVAGVRGTPALVDGRPTTERATMAAAGMNFVLIPGFHDNTNGAARGPNTIIQWTQGGLRFAHFGDYGQDQLTPAQLADLQNIDIAFVPAGGFFTVDGAGVNRLLAQFKPRVAILMHWRTALGGPAQLAAFPAVAEPYPNFLLRPATVTVKRDQFVAPFVNPEVWVMEVSADAVAVNAASFTAGEPAAAGGIISLFGAFTGSATMPAANVPLPQRLGDTDVLVGGNPAPLFYASPGQINLQMPARLAVGQYPIDVRVGGQRVARASVTVVPSAPGVFVVTNEDGRLNTATRPARRGEVLQIYATGQGETSPPVAEGVATPTGRFVYTTGAPQVFIGGRQAEVSFSGLAPGLVGLWQINAKVPDDVRTGSNVELMVVYGRGSNTVALAVQ